VADCRASQTLRGGALIGSSGKGVGIASANTPKTNDNEQRDFASDEGTGKAFATLHVELAMRGLGLHEITDRGYFVSRLHGSRQLPALRAVRVMLMQIGGRR